MKTFELVTTTPCNEQLRRVVACSERAARCLAIEISRGGNDVELRRGGRVVASYAPYARRARR